MVCETSNGPTYTKFLEAPVDSVLSYAAYSSNSPVNVQLHETYEGSLGLRTLPPQFPAIVVYNDSVKDPAGDGRRRDLEITKRWSRGNALGTVRWLPAEEWAYSSVWLSTTNAPVQLSL